MADYKYYQLDRIGRILGPPLPLPDCTDDGTAVTAAKAAIDGLDIEIWHGDRLVTWLKADSKTQR